MTIFCENPFRLSKVPHEIDTEPTSVVFSCLQMVPSVRQHRFSKELDKIAELLDRLSDEQRNAIAARLDQMQNREKKVRELCEALEKESFFASIFKENNLPYYALEALRMREIDLLQFGTIQLFWSIRQYHSETDTIEIIPVSQNHKRAVDLIKATNKIGIQSFLNEKELKQFFEEMAAMPLSERQFFYVPDIQKKGLETILQVIQNLGINIFSRPVKGFRMIPSIGMMQTALNCKYRCNAVKINPVLGVSNFRHLTHVLFKDLSLPFPGVPLPDLADGFSALWYDFSYHDFYHAVRASIMPFEYRKFFVELACLARAFIKEHQFSRDSAEAHTLLALCYVFIDMEFNFYRNETHVPILPALILEIERCFLHILFSKQFQYHPEIADRFLAKVLDELIRYHGSKILDAIKDASARLVYKPLSVNCDYDYLGRMQTLCQDKIAGRSSRPLTSMEKAKLMIAKYKSSQQFSEKDALDELERLNLQNDIKKLLQEVIKKHAVCLYILKQNKISLALLARCDHDEILKIINEQDRIFELLCAGVSWEYILENFKMVAFIEMWLHNGIACDDINRLPQEKRALLLRHFNTIVGLLQIGLKVNDLLTLSQDQLKILVDHQWAFRLYHAKGISPAQLLVLKRSLLLLLLNNHYIILDLLEKIDLKQFWEMSEDSFIKLTTN